MVGPDHIVFRGMIFSVKIYQDVATHFKKKIAHFEKCFRFRTESKLGRVSLSANGGMKNSLTHIQ